MLLMSAAALGAIASVGTQPAYAAGRSVLHTGQFLGVGDFLVAPNEQFFVIMQSDGNLEFTVDLVRATIRALCGDRFKPAATHPSVGATTRLCRTTEI